MNATGRPHGNAKYHLELCRCLVCAQAARAYDNNRRRAIAYGRWQPFVDAEPVRAHVRSLGEFGIGWMRAARLAGVSTGGVSKLLYGDRPRGLAPSRRVRPETALKLLSVEPTLDNLGDRTAVDGTGTRRRLQALVCAGWTQSELARRLGMNRANFGRTIVSRLVEVATLKATRVLYDELWRVGPVAAGVPEFRAAAARRIAVSNGWAPVGAWDDDRIDDPEAFPDWTGHCGTPQGPRVHYRIGVPTCPPCLEARRAQRAA
ncbi:hypothetical protein [Streptomyces violaceus]|uniref:Uncharacterized protein n=1 Tax=Streptomyces violaceus TaxID=1936 RepID=A0ABY9UMS9_STRVL|nr:hypothetical protein [Streptomyces janthinus]WND24145.1 hypothetical protein RI060_43270 [Streptomyces janthinus]GGS96880.1 hypothetical protein GCM10010270_81090 [Streptomyces janthinus]